MDNTIILILVAAGMFAIIGGITLISHIYNLNEIKSKTVGDGQHGTARFSTKRELRKKNKYSSISPLILHLVLHKTQNFLLLNYETSHIAKCY